MTPEQTDRILAAVEKLAAAAERITTVADKVDAVIEAAGGVEGLKEKLAFFSMFAPKRK